MESVLELEAPARRRRAWWRVLVAALLVVVAAAATTVVFGRGQLGQLASALGTNGSLKIANGTLAPTSFGGPQTLLLIGNDQRVHTTTSPVLPHSNEMLLVRIDPGKPWISMMSIPRELEVPIHTPDNGIVSTRLNAALLYGGINLVVSTIKQVTGLSVNHVVEIDFGNFERAINEMGCVYGMIDRRYYHVNVPGGAQYFQVNLQPGYQKLCGSQALQFVTYRHDDTALERDARDQTFLLEAKQEFGPTLIDNITKFEDIFGQTVQTDSSLQTSDGVEKLLGTLISAAGLPVRQVPFQAQPVDQPCAGSTCIVASQQQIQATVNSFLNGKGTPPKKKSTAALAHALHGKKAPSVGLTPVPESQFLQEQPLARTYPFPIEFPKTSVNNGYGLPPDLRTYQISAPGGHRYPIYVGVFSTGLLGQYYDVQGTTWVTAPIFDAPDQWFTVAGRTYYVYYSGQHIQQLAWFANNAAYWIRNTLTLGLTNAQMLAVAESTAPLIGSAAGSVRRDVVHQTAAPATVALRATGSSSLRTVGVIGGAVSLILVPLGLILLLVRQIRLRNLRELTDGAAMRAQALEMRLTQTFGAMPAVAVPGPSSLRARGLPPARGLAARRAATPRPDGATTYSARPRWLRWPVLTAVAAVLTFVVVGGVIVASGGAKPRKVNVAHVARVTAPIAVLNAGTTKGAAARLAHTLAHKGLNVVGAANLGSTPPDGYEVLYTPGNSGQAALLTRALTHYHATVAPIDPSAQAAAGVSAKLAVIIP